MDSSLVRVILATLGGYLLILIFLSIHNWFIQEFPRRPAEVMNSERIQHPFHHQRAIEVLQLFSLLSKPDRTAIQQNLNSNLISIEQWMTRLRQSNFQILCMGELHTESIRRFLSNEFFAEFNVDVLLLETTPRELNDLMKRMEAGRDYFPLLDADIMNILRSVRNRNPDIKIYGIEETDKQSGEKNSQANSRDQWVAKNFWTSFEPGLRHIVLFGALHCMNESGWLFYNLYNQAPPKLRDKMLNVKVLEEHQNGTLEAFVYFINEIGVEKRNFVIPDTHSLSDHIYEWFPTFNHQILEKYESLVVFSCIN
jgi:hypothetical protein